MTLANAQDTLGRTVEKTSREVNGYTLTLAKVYGPSESRAELCAGIAGIVLDYGWYTCTITNPSLYYFGATCGWTYPEPSCWGSYGAGFQVVPMTVEQCPDKSSDQNGICVCETGSMANTARNACVDAAVPTPKSESCDTEFGNPINVATGEKIERHTDLEPVCSVSGSPLKTRWPRALVR